MKMYFIYDQVLFTVSQQSYQYHLFQPPLINRLEDDSLLGYSAV
jgi:hypothetical protein